ncbi:GTA-gp10 family protein [Sphingobium sp. JS3065]|uniref:GTA-gp10 family protein n=1 Tax=Sphingobium sp. JS3065 TaxID=2970925 RepID=UPI00226435F4|nr:GTA-gp10 family protein [Sphingobium sp. JS3065]UZW55945.1 GTA-gp10 family protein [Sphingobium sp. JS3065]
MLQHTLAGKEWTFYFGVNEICEIEQALGKGVGAMLREMQGDLSISMMAAILKAGLRDSEGNAADEATVRAFLTGAGVKAEVVPEIRTGC